MTVPSLHHTVTVYCRHAAGQNMLNVLHFKVNLDTTGVAVTKDGIAEGYYQSLKAQYATRLADAHFVDGCTYNNTQPPIIGLSGKSSGAATAGALTNTTLPAQVSPVISLSPSNTAFKRKCRIFFPCGVEDQTNGDGSLNAGLITSMEAFADNLISPRTITTNDGTFTAQLELWSPLLSQSSPVGGRRIDNFWGTQRRRSGINQGDTRF